MVWRLLFIADFVICVILAIEISANGNCGLLVFDGNISSPVFWTSISQQFSRSGCLQSAVASFQISRRPVIVEYDALLCF
jgi:hypothetical protein